MAVIVAVGVGLAATAISTLGFEQYGAVLFVGLPIVVGALVILLAKPGAPASEFRFKTVAGLPILAIWLLGSILFCTALEGLVCLVMATPLWAPLAILGGGIGLLLRAVFEPGGNLLTVIGLIATIPLGLGAEYAASPEPTFFRVETAIEIDAPPEAVWPHVVEFPPLAEPTELLFQSGIAYPESATIVGFGVGAIRYCTFSTGSFVEPIEVWDEPRLLRFRVTANPEPMHEWSAFQTVHPPHLSGFMISKSGQFELQRLPDGRTRLVGTTWYQHGLAPEWYWRLWSDWIIHSIHRRVLDHVALLAEAHPSGSRSAPAASAILPSMNHADISQQNRLSWNAATAAHNSHKVDQAAFFRAGGSKLFPEEIELLGDVRGARLVHLQCNAGQDTLSIARLGAAVSGVDISDEAIDFARRLSADSGVPGEFVRADVYDWLDDAARAGRQFDVAFYSYGALCWLPDLPRWARGVAAILAPGGRLVGIEFHPVISMFDERLALKFPYFGAEPIRWPDGVHDYVAISGSVLAPSGYTEGVKDFKNPHACIEFNWTVADRLTAMIDAGLSLELVREYPYSNGCKFFEGSVLDEKRRWHLPPTLPAIPQMLAIVASRPRESTGMR